LTVVIGLPAVGVVLMAAMAIIPGVSARFWTDRLGWMLVLAGIFGLAAGVAGTLISSSHAEFPAGAVIVLTGATIFLFSMFLARAAACSPAPCSWPAFACGSPASTCCAASMN
jgi:manganese/zinc/iron transport system permease protein